MHLDKMWPHQQLFSVAESKRCQSKTTQADDGEQKTGCQVEFVIWINKKDDYEKRLSKLSNQMSLFFDKYFIYMTDESLG